MAQKALNLVVHAGGEYVTRERVLASTTPAATAGDPTKKRVREISHQPIPHGLFMEKVINRIEAFGYRIVAESHALGKQDKVDPTLWNHYFGMLQLRNGSNHDDYDLVVGVRNAHDKTFRAGLVGGSGVFVCDNLAFSGQVNVVRKHTTKILKELDFLLFGGLQQLAQLRHKQDNRIEAYKNFELRDQEAHHLMILGMKSGAILPTMLPEVVAQWDEPAHPEFAQSKSVWRLFNAVTEVNKSRTPIFQLPKRTGILHLICDKVTGMDERDPMDVEAIEID